jgi:hypothetical protein
LVAKEIVAFSQARSQKVAILTGEISHVLIAAIDMGANTVELCIHMECPVISASVHI